MNEQVPVRGEDAEKSCPCPDVEDRVPGTAVIPPLNP